MNKSLAIIVPCFNEEKNIQNFYKRLIATISKLNLEYKIFFVDDGSDDDTWQIIKDLKFADDNIYAIKLSRNFGHQSARDKKVKIIKNKE